MEDHEIITLFKQRSEMAIIVIKEKYGRYCYQVAWNILENEQDVEEVLSDLWLHVWNSIPPQEPYAMRSFLAKITQNLSFDRYRKETAIKRGGSQLRVVMEELESCIPVDNSPERHLMQNSFQCLSKVLCRNCLRGIDLFLLDAIFTLIVLQKLHKSIKLRKVAF